jgi:hypothetical protein
LKIINGEDKAYYLGITTKCEKKYICSILYLEIAIFIIYIMLYYMAKRGRKRKGYFYEEQETAVSNYIHAQTKEEKDEIFDTWLKPAFTKMIESIIRRYKLYLPDEEFTETFNDTISFLMTKIELFNPDKGFKAYSYCGTICKNYLLFKINQFKKSQARQESYEDIYQVFTEDNEKTTDYFEEESNEAFLTGLISKTTQKIQNIIDNTPSDMLTNNERKIGYALINLLTNWNEIFQEMGSNKFNKSSIILYLKEATCMDTTEIRLSMKKYKSAYYNIKKDLIEN